MEQRSRKSARNQKSLHLGPFVAMLAMGIAAIVAGALFFTRPSANNKDATSDVSTKEEAAASVEKDTAAENETTDKQSEDSTAGKDTDAKSDDNASKEEAPEEDGTSSDEAADEAADIDSTEEGDQESTDASTEGSETSDAASSSDGSVASSDGSESESAAVGSGTGDGSGSGNSSGGNETSQNPTGFADDSGTYQVLACATCEAENGSITASGIPFNDSIPQIGIETSSFARSHFGDYVDITYNGITVRAQVVDCGAYYAGSYGIVINPGVFTQFGVYSAYDWGYRAVEYRFV